MTAIGIDLVEIQRIKKFIDSKTPQQLLRVFTQQEITYALSSKTKYQRFAVRFAAKEAFFKAFGYGNLSEIEVSQHKDKQPFIKLQGKTKKKWDNLSCPNILLSLSHTDSYAIAMITIEK